MVYGYVNIDYGNIQDSFLDKRWPFIMIKEAIHQEEIRLQNCMQSIVRIGHFQISEQL
jgi:hypothetical protein